MVPVEAMASGRPVIAFGRGGATETVDPGITGIFFSEQTVGAIAAAVSCLSEMNIDPERISRHAKQFGREQFFQKMRAHIDSLLLQGKSPARPGGAQAKPT
jgi:glycosyltransferase involved in cell wall biosynthesis